MESNDKGIFLHSWWNCKYCIAFAPKCIRILFYESHRAIVFIF